MTSTLSPLHGGGVVEVASRLSEALVQRGHRVSVYTSDFEWDQEYVDSLSSVNVSPFHIWLDPTKFRFTPSLIWKVKKELKEFDIIHMHNYRNFANIVVHHYARKYRIPYVLQSHGSAATYFQKGALKRVFDKLWGYRILNDASTTFAVTKTEAQQYMDIGISHNKIDIVPNGISLSEYEELPPKGDFRKQYGISNDDTIILYLGRVNKIKGIDCLVKAFAQLRKNIPATKLVIAGPDDGYFSRLKNIVYELGIECDVVFPGPLHDKNKISAYVDAAVYVLPSNYEIFGMTLLEAWACGTPVITTDQCGLADVVANNQAGLVVPYDSNSLHDALYHILNDEECQQRFGENGKSLVRNQFNWEKIAKQVEDIYAGSIISA